MYFDNIGRLKAIKTPCRYFELHHIKKLKAYIIENDKDLWLFICFMYYCFIRPNELRRLKISDILFEREQIIVRGEISKNKKQEYVTIPDYFFNEIQYLKEYNPNDYIFASSKDLSKPIGEKTMTQRHRNILKKLGFPAGFALYSWKHTGAVHAAKNGISVKELQIQLRHHSLDQVDQYLRQLGVHDIYNLKQNFPTI